MKIRLKINVSGTFHNIGGGVKVGDVVEVDDVNGARYCKLGYAEPVVDRHEERAVVEPKVEERSQSEAPAVEAEDTPAAPQEPVEESPEPAKADLAPKPRRPGRQASGN